MRIFHKFAPLVIGGAMAFGFGYGIAVSEKPFVLEANTPLGSFVLKGNLAYPELLSPPNQKTLQPFWFDHVA